MVLFQFVLFFSDRTYRALSCTCSTGDAGVLVDLKLAVTGLNCTYRALLSAGTTGYALI